ncbi:COG3656 Predicted periplasmic protein [Acidimicrobiia bacterium]
MSSSESRYEAISRRSMLAGTAALGAALAIPALGCGGNNDKSVFGTSTTQGGSPATTGTGPLTTASGPLFPEGGEMIVDFTFATTEAGAIKNPYIAVWIETPEGALAKTVSFWFQQTAEGKKYLSDMRKWFAATSGDTPSNSGATRLPGAYSVVWDGTNEGGQPVAQGDYVVYIEAAREDGPYQVISQPISIGTASFNDQLTPKGELTTASIAYKP